MIAVVFLGGVCNGTQFTNGPAHKEVYRHIFRSNTAGVYEISFLVSKRNAHLFLVSHCTQNIRPVHHVLPVCFSFAVNKLSSHRMATKKVKSASDYAIGKPEKVLPLQRWPVRSNPPEVWKLSILTHSTAPGHDALRHRCQFLARHLSSTKAPSLSFHVDRLDCFGLPKFKFVCFLCSWYLIIQIKTAWIHNVFGDL